MRPTGDCAKLMRPTGDCAKLMRPTGDCGVATMDCVNTIVYHFAKQNVFFVKSNHRATHNCLQDDSN